jgi:hypothetical protein
VRRPAASTRTATLVQTYVATDTPNLTCWAWTRNATSARMPPATSRKGVNAPVPMGSRFQSRHGTLRSGLSPVSSMIPALAIVHSPKYLPLEVLSARIAWYCTDGQSVGARRARPSSASSASPRRYCTIEIRTDYHTLAAEDHCYPTSATPSRLSSNQTLRTKLIRVRFVTFPGMPWETGPRRLPMRQALASLDESRYFPDAILDAGALRGLLNAVVAYAGAAVAEFDAVFGSRA